MTLLAGTVVGISAVMAGTLSGLLMANFGRDKDRQASPWPYIVGIVLILAVAGATVTATAAVS